jgi:hypothetical protein
MDGPSVVGMAMKSVSREALRVSYIGGIICVVACVSLLSSQAAASVEHAGARRAELRSWIAMTPGVVVREAGRALKTIGWEAKPGFSVFPPSEVSSFRVPGTHGFDLSVYVLSNSWAILEARTPGARIEYETRVRRVDGVIRARFGALGSLTMRFIPDGPAQVTREPQGDCRGKRAMVQSGTFLGRLRWRGEHGFSSVNVRRAQGLSIHSFREVCKGFDAGAGTGRAVNPSLEVRSNVAGRSITLQAYFTAATPNLMAEVAEKNDGLSIRRWISELGTGEVFLGVGTRVRVDPSRPFISEAEFVPGVGNHGSWTGALTGEFPGVGEVSLAGSTFRATVNTGS